MTRDTAAGGGHRRHGARQLAIAEQSYFWLGAERTTLAHGTVTSGEQMYVEYQIPVTVRHPVPVVLVHGGGGQGLDYLGRPDGGPGWATLLLEAGYAVYVVDRPGLGRSPFYPDLLGPMGPSPTFESLVSMFTAPEKAEHPLPNAHLHTRWPGSGQLGDPALDASAASSGPSMADLAGSHELWRTRGRELLERIGPAVVVTHSAGGPFGWMVADECPDLVRAIVAIEPVGPPFSSFGPGPGLAWGLTAAPLHFDPPAEEPGQLQLVTMTAPAGGRPYRLQADPVRKLHRLAGIPIAVVTSEASSFVFNDPATVDFLVQAGCDTVHLRLADHGVHGNGHFMMLEENAEEALQPILRFLTERVDDAVAGAGRGDGPAGGGAGSAHREAGSSDSTHREAGSAATEAGSARREAGSAATEAGSAGPVGHPPLELADQGHFWTGVERRRQREAGTAAYAPMFVRYQVPTDRRHEHPFVLVHGGGGQGLVFMGRGSGEAGWNEELLAAGWATYIVDRPGHGRAPYDPSVLGDWLPPAAYEPTVGLFEEAAGPGGQWDGSGTIGDPAVDQFFAQQGPTQADVAVAHDLNRSRGAELLERIGPAVILTHSAGGPFGWVVADERPELVRAIVAVEAAGMPFARHGRFALPWGLTASPVTYDPPVSDPADLDLEEVPAGRPDPAPGSLPGEHRWTLQRDPPRRLANLAKVPIAVVTAERSRLRAGSLAAIAYLRQAGCSVTHLDLPALGIFGNGHFMLLEKNRAAVLGAICRWVEDTLDA